jgi:hypothetical protein
LPALRVDGALLDAESTLAVLYPGHYSSPYPRPFADVAALNNFGLGFIETDRSAVTGQDVIVGH